MASLLQPVLLPRLHFPIVFGGEEPSPFSRGEHERHLRIVLDDAGLPSSSALEVMLELAQHESLDITTTTRAGPSTISFDPAVIVNDHIPVTVERRDGLVTHTAIWPASTWLHFAREHARRHGDDPLPTNMRFLLAGAADGRVDGLVLSDPGFSYDVAKRSNPLTATQAIALIGLFLRAREAPVIEIGAGRRHVALGTQRFIVGRCLLEAGWRWWSACAAAGSAAGGEATMRVAQGVQTRFERCLRARDEVMIRCLQDARGRSIDRDVLYHLDAMLLWLGGVLDVIAHIADHAYGLATPTHLVGWRSRDWRKKLARAAPTLFNATEPGSTERAVIDLIATFRNTIHGEPVSGVTYSSGGDERGLIQLPDTAETEAVDACSVLGGKEKWGYVREGIGPVAALWDPYLFVQMILPSAATVMNSLMGKAEVERLPGVAGKPLIATRPTGGFFEPDVVQRLLLMHGFPE